MNHRENEPSALRTFYFVLSILLLALGFLASIWALVGMFVRHMMVWYSFRCMVAILLYSFGGAALYACWDDCFEGDSSKRRRKRGFAFAWLSLLPFALSACLLLLPIDSRTFGSMRWSKSWPSPSWAAVSWRRACR